MCVCKYILIKWWNLRVWVASIRYQCEAHTWSFDCNFSLDIHSIIIIFNKKLIYIVMSILLLFCRWLNSSQTFV